MIRFVTRPLRGWGLRSRWRLFFHYDRFPPDTVFPLKYHLRRILQPQRQLPCFVRSRAGGRHLLANDSIDDRVLEEMLGRLSHLYFPDLGPEISPMLQHEGWILDIGAYHGSWTIEYLTRFPNLKALLIEPNSRKVRNLHRSLQANDLVDRAMIIQAGLASAEGSGWLLISREGSWANRIQSSIITECSAAEKVPTVTLAKALGGIKPLIVKSNAEGAEYELVKQLIEIGLHPKLLILMVHPEYGDSGSLGAALQTYGYSVTIVRDSDTTPCWHARLLEG